MPDTPPRLAAYSLGITLALGFMLIVVASGAAFLIAFNPAKQRSQTPIPDVVDTRPSDDGPGPGDTREQPVPIGMVGTTQNWEIEILSHARGEDAAAIAGLESSARATGDETELLAVEVMIGGRDALNDTVTIDTRSFALSGSYNVRYDPLILSDFAPSLRSDVGPGDMAGGFLVFEVGESEGNFILEFRPIALTDADDHLYVMVTADPIVETPTINIGDAGQTGVSVENPASPGEWVTNGLVAARVMNLLNGDEAVAFITTELGGDADDLDEDLNFITVQIGVLNVAEGPDFVRVDQRSFGLAPTERGSVSDELTEPPSLDARLYPDGYAEGWLVIEYSGEQVPVLVLESLGAIEPRYLALE